MRADRLLSIMLLLEMHERMTAADLAKRLEVSERTILRDMDALSGAGIPVIAERGAGGGWRLIEGYRPQLTGLTGEEVQSLFFSRPAGALAELGFKEASDSAWLKLWASLGERARATSSLQPTRRFGRPGSILRSTGKNRRVAFASSFRKFWRRI